MMMMMMLILNTFLYAIIYRRYALYQMVGVLGHHYDQLSVNHHPRFMKTQD